MQSTRREALSLQQNELLRIHDGMGSTVVVCVGEVWLTQDGDQRDVFLSGGESFTLDVASPAVLQALATSYILLVEPARQPKPQHRLTRAWARMQARVMQALGARHPRVEPWAAA